MPDIYDQLLDETPDQQAVPVAAAGDTSAPDAYDVLLDEYQENQQQRMRASLDAALTIAPKQAADAERLAKASGLPLAVVERNQEAVQKQVQLREVQSMLADSPILSRQMQDPHFAALAHQDVKNLGLIERTARGFSGGMTEMVGRTFSGLGELGDVFQRNTLNALSAALLPEPRHGSKADIDSESLYGPMIGEGWRGAGTLAKDFARDDLMIPSAQQTFYDHVAGGLGQVTGQILMHLATGGVASVPSMYAQGADIMAEAVADDDAEQWRKDLAILGGGAVTAVTEKWALDRIMGPLAVPVKNKIGAALLRVGIAGASEGAQEMAEGIMHDALRVYLTNPEAGFDFAENLYEGGVGATVGTIARSFVEAALHVRTRGARRQQEAEEAEKNAELMEDLHKLAQASELLQTSPETFEQFIAEATEDGPVQDIYIDANFLMQSGLAEQVAELSPSVAEQIETAAATGGTVQVPLAEYARTIAPTEYAQQLLDHLKTEPQGFSRAEARAYMQNEAQELEAELEQMLGGEEEQLEFKASQERVKQTILDELNTLGRFTEQKNELDATLIAARTAVRAAQLGTTPEALFERQRLRFAAEPITGDQYDQGALQQFGILESDLSLPVDELIARNEVPPVNSTEPGVAQDLPLGSIRVAPYGGNLDERYVDVLTEVPVDSLLIAEPEDNIRSTPVYQQYVQWALEGREAPLIQVNQNERGEYVAANRRRALAAKEAGIPTLRAWVSPINPATGDPLKYGDLRGQQFDQSGQLQTDTPAFRKWFGDSKVVDADGKPLVVYHGSNANIEVFNTEGGPGKTSDTGAFFSTNPATAGTYTGGVNNGNITPVYLNLRTPAVFDAGGANWNQLGKKTKVQLPAIEVSDQADADLLAELAGTEPERGATKKRKARSTSLGRLFPDDFLYDDFFSTDDLARWARAQGYDGVVINNVKDQGPTGALANEASQQPGSIYVAFRPEQIKSAIGNRGTFDPNDPNILHQSEQRPDRPLPEGYDPDRNLYVAHNLSAENILAADELGGLAAPSIAVGRTDIGFDDFGEVTLLADPQLLTDKKIRTFDADVYSPRQPRAHYDIDTAAFRAFTDTLDPDNLGLSHPDINELSGTDGADALLRSDAVRLKFLQERNKAPRLKNAKTDPLVKRAAKLEVDRYSLQSDPKVVALAVKYYEGMVQKAEAGGRGERYRSMWFNEDGTLQSNSLRSFADHVRRFKETDGKDVDQFRRDLRDKFHNQKLSDEYQQWAADHFNTMVKGRRLFKGFTNAGNRRYIPYTLENVVKEMTQQLQAGEGSFYGAGSVRSAYANELRTLDQIRERRGQIVSKEEFEKLRDESNAVLQDALEKLKPFYKFDADSWGYAEDAGSAIAEGPKGIREAFETTPEVQQIIGELTDYLRAMPTTYFEAKAQRAMQFSEFDTAVVPKGMRKDALQVLRDAGLKIKTYDRNVEGSREQVVAKQQRLLFQNQRAPRGAYNPETNTIALLKNADLSTFLHEAGHYFFESDIALAAEIVDLSRTFGEQTTTEGERQILTDVSALLRWHGIQGSIEEQLDQWFNMDFEEKRVYHERTAESFERYLFEGKAPSIEMQPYFQKFRAWLTNVYRSLKDFLQRNPEAGKLSDEVRAVFDRMLATEDQIKLAEQGRSMMPLFRTEAEASNIGMTPEEFKAYQETDEDATTEAVQDLERKGLRDLQWLRNAHNREVRKLRKQASALRSEAQMEARREVMSQPVYRAWQFLTAKITDEDRLSPAERPKSDPDVLDPTQDDLLAAMAKLGGLNKEAAVAEWGVDPADRPSSGVFGKPVLRAKDSGLTIEEMAESLAEQGYIPRDEHGNYDIRELEDRFFAALRGETVYSDWVDASVLLEPVPGEGADLSQISAGRLDLGALREMGVDETSINLLKARRMTARDGIHPDLVGPLFQYPDGQTLVDALLEATPPREEIDALTETKMLERHGELASPEAIEREADRAIHNETRARMVTTEHNALAQASGGKKLMRQAAREFARHMVGRSKIRDLSPHKYTSAEVRAAKAAEAASRAGDIAKAATEKRNQLVNIYAAKAAMDARAEVDTSLRYLSKFNREGTRKNLDAEYLEQIDTILERFDLRAGQSLKAIDKRATLAKWVEGMEAEGLEPDIPDYIMAEANRTHYKNMTMEQFQGMVESIRQIEHLGRLKKRLLTAKDQRELDAIVEEMRERIEASSGGRTVDNERRNTAKSWMKHMFRGALAAHRKAASVVREMDGFEEGGPLWERIIRPMNERGEWEVTMRADAAQRLHDLAKPVLALGPMGGNGDYFATLGRSLNRGERIAIALNYGNESNRQRLLGGRNWTDAQIQPVLSSLTATEWTFVQGVWEFFESYRPEIAAKERRVYGKEPDWIEPSPFTVRTADGQTLEIAGGYYPIKYDPRQSGKAGEFAEAEDAKAMMRAAYTAATTRRSFTKTRAEEVHGRPLLLTFDGIWQGANEVIHDLAWHEWLIDANRLMKRLDSAIRTHYGAEYVDVLRNTIKDVARGDIPAANTIEAALTHVRNGSSIVGMGWNLFTALLQPLGIANSIVRVGNGSNREGAKWIGKGMSQFYGSPRHMLDKVREVQGMSEFMANRARTMNREIADVRNRLETGKGDFQMKLEGTYFLLIQRMQELVDYPTWLGAYEKAIADPKNLNPDGAIDEARAVALADQAVIDSQSAGTIKDLAQVQRGHPAMKLFTNFYSYFSVLLNMSVEQGRMRVQRKEYAGLMSDYLILLVVPAVLSAVMREALRGQDDEDEYLKAIASELVGYPFGMFVLGRELTGAAQLAAGVGNPAFGYSGPAGLRFFSEINKLGQQAGQGDLDMALFKAANNVGGILFHYPAGQVNRLVDGTSALIEGRTENPLAPIVGPLPQR